MHMKTLENGKGELIPICITYCDEAKEIEYYYNDDGGVLTLFNRDLLILYKGVSTTIFVADLNIHGFLLVENAFQNNWSVKYFVRNTNFYYVIITFQNSTLIFRDWSKLIPLSVDKLHPEDEEGYFLFPIHFIKEKNLNYEGSLPDIKYWNIPSKNKENIYEKIRANKKIFNFRMEIQDFCKKECRLIKIILTNLLVLITKTCGSTMLMTTFSAASLSSKYFFFKFNDFEIHKQATTTENEYSYSSFYGGRCEVFGNLKAGEFIKFFDFPGMYSHCMTGEFFNGNPHFTDDSSFREIGFHTITFKSDQLYLPILPNRHNNRVYFSNGIMTGTYWYEEIILFEKYGGKIIDHHHSLIYPKLERVFEKFVVPFQELRKLGGYYRIFGKLMVNALYGSLATRIDDTYCYITTSEEEYSKLIQKTHVLSSVKINSIYCLTIANDYRIKKYTRTKNKRIGHVGYSSSIASKSRILLYQLLQDVIKDGGRLLYCNTDSIYAAYPKQDTRVETTTGLVKWQSFYDDGFFAAPHIYTLKNTIWNHKSENLICKINKNFKEQKHFLHSTSKRKFNPQGTCSLPYVIQNGIIFDPDI